MNPIRSLRFVHTAPRTLARSSPSGAARLSPQSRDHASSFLSASASASASSSSSSSASGSGSASSSKAVETAHAGRDMIRATPPEDTSRRSFHINQMNPPHDFLPSSLSPTPRPAPRPPLLGPPNKLARRIDPFHITGSRPLAHALNPNFSMAFINSMGKIQSRAETGLTWAKQRAVGKMVRRARAMGVVPRWSKNPRTHSLAAFDESYYY